MVVFMGLQSYVAGEKGRQDERGNMIGESLRFLGMEVRVGISLLTKGDSAHYAVCLRGEAFEALDG